MCGIVGFTGRQQAAPILLEGLSRLEYRGYDSAGLAVRDGDNLAEVVKATGKLRNLAERPTTAMHLQALVASGTPAGPPMARPASPMLIPTSAATVSTPVQGRWSLR